MTFFKCSLWLLSRPKSFISNHGYRGGRARKQPYNWIVMIVKRNEGPIGLLHGFSLYLVLLSMLNPRKCTTTMTAMDATWGNSLCWLVVATAPHNEKPMAFSCIHNFHSVLLSAINHRICTTTLTAMDVTWGNSLRWLVVATATRNERPMAFSYIHNFHPALLSAFNQQNMYYYYDSNGCNARKQSLLVGCGNCHMQWEADGLLVHT